MSSSRLVQLDMTSNTIDPLSGLTKILDIADGSSATVMLCEDVGQKRQHAPTHLLQRTILGRSGDVNRQQAVALANPDSASGINRKINSAKGGTYTTPNPVDGCYWSVADCGPNGGAFSFHGDGANFAFADGHVSFIRETISPAILRGWSLETREARKHPPVGRSSKQPVDFSSVAARAPPGFR